MNIDTKIIALGVRGYPLTFGFVRSNPMLGT